jgi:hypothetical protein
MLVGICFLVYYSDLWPSTGGSDPFGKGNRPTPPSIPYSRGQDTSSLPNWRNLYDYFYSSQGYPNNPNSQQFGAPVFVQPSGSGSGANSSNVLESAIAPTTETAV